MPDDFRVTVGRPFDHAVRILLHHWGDLVMTFLTANLVPVPIARLGSAATSAQMVVAVLGLLCIVEGLRSLKNSPAQSSGLYPAIWVFCLFNLLTHMMWIYTDVRFLYPCIPFALLIGMKGSETLMARSPAWRLPVAVLGLTVLLTYSAQGYWAIQKTRHPSSKIRWPLVTLEWIRQHLPAETTLLTAQPAVIRLYTDRFGSPADLPVMPRTFDGVWLLSGFPMSFYADRYADVERAAGSRSDSGVGRADEVGCELALRF